MKKLCAALWITVACLILISNIAFSLSLITDAETENEIKAFITPLIKAANLNPSNIKIRIVADPDINAFVIGGGDVFINTGLIIKFADDPNILYAVMAHEIAHLYAGHIIAKRGEYEKMSKVAMGSGILGLATALAGAPEAGIMLGMAGATGAQQNMLQYSRMHETEADKIAVNFLYKTRNNGEGLIKLFRYLSRFERGRNIDPYAITHPLSAERIASVENSIKNKLGSFTNENVTPRIRFEFKRIAAKLEAFLGTPSTVIKRYKNDNYALSIGYFRSGQLEKALGLLNQVLEKEPNDPYLWELKGQYYFDNGRFDQSMPCYKKALQYLPNDRIIKLELAANIVNKPSEADNINKAIALLKQVIHLEPSNIMAYFTLSRAYGKLGDQMRAISALAECYFYQGSLEKSKILANKVIKMTKPGSKEYIRAHDIIEYVKVERVE